MNKRIGGSLNKFLKEEGLLEESELVAAKWVIATELEHSLKVHEITKTELAEKIGTTRAGVDRLLDPKNTSVTLRTLQKAARAIGKKLRLVLV